MFANSAVAQYYVLFASRVVGLSALDWGLVTSLQFVAASVLRIPGGWLSDRAGKKKIMVISLLTTVPTILLFTFSQSFLQVAVAAVLLVATGIYFAPAYEALQADFAPRSIRGRLTAFWDMSSAVSAALGALFGGFTFQTFGPAVPFYVFAAAELLAAFLLIRLVKEPLTRED
jgi:MFS family permease